MRYLALSLLIFSIVVSCDKENVPNGNDNTGGNTDTLGIEEHELPIGDWEIVSVDSGYIANRPGVGFVFLEKLSVSGSISFGDDNTGLITGDVTQINCGIEDFYWMQINSKKVLYFVLMDGFVSKGIIEKMNNDTLVFNYRDWCRGGQATGATTYYRITAVK